MLRFWRDPEIMDGARQYQVAAAAGALLVQPRMLRPELAGVLGLQPVGERSVLLQYGEG